MKDERPRCSLSCHEGREMEPTPEQVARERRNLITAAAWIVAVVVVALLIIF